MNQGLDRSQSRYFIFSNHEEREAYEAHLKWLRIDANTLKKAEAKGIELGIELGKADGIELIAKKMLTAGLDMDMISKVSGLSQEQIKALI